MRALLRGRSARSRGQCTCDSFSGPCSRAWLWPSFLLVRLDQRQLAPGQRVYHRSVVIDVFSFAVERHGRSCGWRWLLVLSVTLFTAGCGSMLPSSTNATSSFRHFEDLRAAVDSLQPHKSDQGTLVRLGIDPGSLPNTTILSYAELLRRFQPGTVAIRDELDPGIVACLLARDACRGWELNVAYVANERTGSFLADFFNFRRRTVTTGWRFNALILMANGVVVYRAWGGQPSVNQVDRRANPLGPLQDIGPAVVVNPL